MKVAPGLRVKRSSKVVHPQAVYDAARAANAAALANAVRASEARAEHAWESNLARLGGKTEEHGNV